MRPAAPASTADLFGTRPSPAFPAGAGGEAGPVVTAMVYEVHLDAPGIHTKSHFAGTLTTHPFFSRAAVHAALFDLWQPVAPDAYVGDEVPYASTPLVAINPTMITLHYASSAGWDKGAENRRGLTVGSMQAMAPGTLLRGAVWGDPAELPDLFVGRAFTIGKRRAAARVTRCVRADVPLQVRQQTKVQLPIEVPRQDLADWTRRVAMRSVAATLRYSVVHPALDSRVPRFILDDITVPTLDYWHAFNPGE